MTIETTTISHASATSNSTDKQRGSLKTKRDEIDPAERLPKPNWIRVKAALPLGRFREAKDIVRANHLVTVCEEASCPNIGECWSKGTATFMIMGDKCTRRCRFCNVSTGRPNPLDINEPERLAQTIALMKLNYVVITSVDRDDLRDCSGGHFSIEVISPRLAGRSMCERQRLVYGTIAHLMQDDALPVHAVDSLKTRTSARLEPGLGGHGWPRAIEIQQTNGGRT